MRERDPRAALVEEGLSRHGQSVRWLARKIGMSAPGLGYLLKEGARPQKPGVYESMLDAIRELDEQGAAVAGQVLEARSNATKVPLKAEPSGRIKIYGAVSAGTGNTMTIDAEEMDVPIQFARDDYGALIIDGDSMIPFLQPSDVVIFKDWSMPKPGHVVAAQLEDGSWVAKLMVYENASYKLRSLNPMYKDYDRSFTITGFLVGIVRDVGDERVIRLNPYGIRP